MTSKHELLSSIKKSIETKPLVILDLDNTCICSVEMKYIKKVPNSSTYRYVDFENVYRIYERPGLQTMLDHLFCTYDVAVWTAAGLTYAIFVVRHFILNKPGRQLEFMMWDDHCDYVKNSTNQSKDMTYLKKMYPNRSMVLVDDNVDVLQQEMTINSVYFDVLEPHSHLDTFCTIIPHMIKEYFS